MGLAIVRGTALPGTGNGQYTSLNQCQSSCITPTWDCDGGTCFDPGNGMGLYATLNDCEAACTNVGLEVFNLEGLKIYPNPSSDIFNIEFSSIRKQTLNIRIYNSLGKNILEDHLNDFQEVIIKNLISSIAQKEFIS